MVKNPRSYREDNMVYTGLNVTFAALIFEPFDFLGKEDRMHGD